MLRTGSPAFCYLYNGQNTCYGTEFSYATGFIAETTNSVESIVIYRRTKTNTPEPTAV